MKLEIGRMKLDVKLDHEDGTLIVLGIDDGAHHGIAVLTAAQAAMIGEALTTAALEARANRKD